MAGAAAAEREVHALLFPFPTLGHINPMSLLAAQLARVGVNLTLVHTTWSFSLLTTKSQRSLQLIRSCGGGRIDFEVLEDALVEEKDGVLPVSPSVRVFMKSFPLLRSGFRDLLRRLATEGRLPACIISDSFLPWSLDVANEFGIPRIEFWSSSVTVYAMGLYIPELISRGYIPVPPSGANAEERIIDFIPGIGSWKYHDFFYDLTVYPISSPIFKFFQEAFSRGKESQRVIVHSAHDWEKNVVLALRGEGVPIDPIGPLLQPEAGQNIELARSTPENAECLEWLDKQTNSSVIFVSFGSNVQISTEEIQELALGLENSHQPFLLVIRQDFVPDKSVTDILPEGFVSRTKERGKVTSWAPQLAVLAHDAVAGFFTHCGWNSTLETIWMGKPMIGCPRESEQNTNLKFLLDLGVVIPVDEGKNSVELKRHLVTKAIQTLMQTPEGQRVRKNMSDLKATARRSMECGESRLNFIKLVEDIKEMSIGGRPRFLEQLV